MQKKKEIIDLGKKLAMQIASLSPLAIDKEDLEDILVFLNNTNDSE